MPRAARRAEGDGYLLATVYRGAEHRSDLAVFDAAAVDTGPIAVAELSHSRAVRLPRQLAAGSINRQITSPIVPPTSSIPGVNGR